MITTSAASFYLGFEDPLINEIHILNERINAITEDINSKKAAVQRLAGYTKEYLLQLDEMLASSASELNHYLNPNTLAGGKVGNGAGSVSGSAVTANGQWEEIIIKVTGFPSEATCATQIHFMPLGALKGTAFYNGAAFITTDGKAPYLDVAAWAIFPNLASANAFDLSAEAKK